MPAALPRLATALHRARLLGAAGRAVGRVARPRGFQILTYHRVNDDGDPFFPSLPTAVFTEHMSYVAATHQVRPVEELALRAQAGTLPPSALAITFDDGYRDTLTHAAPVLVRLGLPATVFLTTGLIGTAAWPWFDRLAHGLKMARVERVRGPWGETVLDTASHRLAALDRILAYFKEIPDDRMRRELPELLESLGGKDAEPAKSVMLSWEDVAALTGLGFAVGAHTVSHPILSRVTPDQARREIETSARTIAAACGRAPKAFAYPNGGPADYTPEVVDMVRAAGFTCAVTTRFGLNTRSTPAWELRRGGPWEHDLPTFALKLSAYRLFRTE
jgi:peptidoglycan/xylan/chitin deacetylase (PgdA/CDA1 family)